MSSMAAVGTCVEVQCGVRPMQAHKGHTAAAVPSSGSLPETHQLGALHSEEVREGDEEILDGRLTGGAPSSEGERGHSSNARCCGGQPTLRRQALKCAVAVQQRSVC